jgi:hypothetical protein
MAPAGTGFVADSSCGLASDCTSYVYRDC